MEFVHQTDSVPQFWQFLRGLTLDDLIVELVQNDLDAKASQTSITFHPGRLVCEGDGDVVSDDGWRRLAYISGAGYQVESKRFGIGVKNHGLKSCFILGDEVIIRSGGRKTIQTLYKDGTSNPPFPGAWKEPGQDEEAPFDGCSIEVPYRQKRLVVTKGEPLEIDPTDDDLVEKLFWNACAELPGKLMGAVRPGIQDQYTLSLNHHSLGSVEIHWRAKRPWHVNGRGRRQFTLFSRECTISSNCADMQSEVIHERACTFKVGLPSGTRHEIPDFFTLDRRYFVAEIAWLTDAKGRPRTSRGVRRYPIGYAPTSKSALTGLGVHFSGPYVSDAERHGVSQLSSLNDHIDNACKDALVEIMACHLLHRHGGKAMELYLDDPSSPDDDGLADLISRSVNKRALPLRPKKSLASVNSKPLPSGTGRRTPPRLLLGPRRRARGTVRRVVLPMFTWHKDRISPILSEICPSSEDQIDKSVPGPILAYIRENLIGDEPFMVFNENDVIERLQLEANDFPWDDESDWKKSLGDIPTAKKYLDVVYERILRSTIRSEEAVAQNAHLPDDDHGVRPLGSMHGAVNLPPNLPDRHAVRLLHRDLQGHPLLRRKSWKPKRFTLDNYLDSASLEDASSEDRWAFWEWLRDNAKRVNDRQLRKIRNLPIWPSDDGDLLTFEEFCKPPTRRTETILGDAIQRPSPEILKVGLVNKKGTGRIKFRKAPTQEEVDDFFRTRMLDAFPGDLPLTPTERRAFHKFERDLVVLSSSPSLKKLLTDLSEDYAAALSQGGTLEPPGDLVRVEGALHRLHLSPQYIIDRPARELDRIEGWAPSATPATHQIVDSLRGDRERRDAHIPRLQEYVKQAQREGIEPNGVRDLACIPFNGELFAPSQLALRGRLNYWGDWKVEIPARPINAEVQDLYQRVGVVGGRPTQLNSMRFFQWLASQTPDVVSRHIDQILRHISHGDGPTKWSDMFPYVPFIPAEGCDGGTQLFTKSDATRGVGRVVIPDFESLADEIRKRPGKFPVELAVVESARVAAPVTVMLRSIGLKSLRDRAGEPKRVISNGGNIARPSFDFETILKSLQSGRRGQQLNKRLDRLGLSRNRLRSNWRQRLSYIKDVRTSDSVTAKYQVSRSTYDVPVDGELDRASSTLWLRSASDLRETFFDILADRIFEDPQKYLGSVLERAYKIDIKERHPLLEHTAETQLSDEIEDYGIVEQLEDGTQVVATEGRHSAPNTDPSRNLPSPGPIPEGTAITKGARKVSPSRSSRIQSPSESAQIDDLKANQYAWHCQACLATKEPNILAPLSSYVGLHENRRPLIEAQHCDHVNAGGARHAGNIILLCKYHHGALGDAFGRLEIVKSLDQSADRTVAFATEGDKRKVVHGKIVSISPPQRPNSVPLFFTREHMDYWLKKASEERIS